MKPCDDCWHYGVSEQTGKYETRALTKLHFPVQCEKDCLHPNKIAIEDIDMQVWNAFKYAEQIDGGCPFTVDTFSPDTWQLIGHIRRLQGMGRTQTAFARAFPNTEIEAE